MARNMIQIAAQFYDARDACKVILGAGYAERMEKYAGFIRMKMQNEGIESAILAGAKLAENLASKGDRFPAVCMLAAAVEMIEPTRPVEAPSDG